MSEEIVREYLSGVSMWDLQKKHRITWKKVRDTLTNAGVTLRTPAENRALPFDRSFFKRIDSHEKAYWLGFLMADGNVCGKIMQCCIKDKGHLDRLKAAMKADQAIRLDRNQSRFSIVSQELVDDLFRLGMEPRKSLTIKFPSEEQVPREFIHSYMLGFFDGDGSIQLYQPKKGNRKWNFSIIAPRDFCDGFNKILSKKCNLFENVIVKYKRIPDKDISEIHLCGVYRDRLERIYNFLYRDYAWPLERKKRLFLDVIQNGLKEPYESKYYGVCRSEQTCKKWVTQKKIAGKRIVIGYFETEELAAKAFDNYLKENSLDLRYLNFPDV